MKISIIYVGKKSGDHEEKIEEYKKRILKYSDLEYLRLESVENTDGNTKTNESKIVKESEKIMEKIKPSDYVILLDEIGSDLGSLDFAAMIDDRQNDSSKRVVFIIGGAYGVSKEIIDRANYILRLGKMVWPHELVRLMLSEQLYRAYSILADLPYHHR